MQYRQTLSSTRLSALAVLLILALLFMLASLSVAFG